MLSRLETHCCVRIFFAYQDIKCCSCKSLDATKRSEGNIHRIKMNKLQDLLLQQSVQVAWFYPVSNISHRISLGYVCIQFIGSETYLNCENERKKKHTEKRSRKCVLDRAWQNNCELSRCNEGRGPLEKIEVCTVSGGPCKRPDKSATQVQWRSTRTARE